MDQNNSCTILPPARGQHTFQVADNLPAPQTGFSHFLDARSGCNPTEQVKHIHDRQQTVLLPHLNQNDMSQSYVMNHHTPIQAVTRLDSDTERNRSKGSPHLLNWLRHLIPENLLRRGDQAPESSHDYRSPGKPATWQPMSVVDYEHRCRSDSRIADGGHRQDRVTHRDGDMSFSRARVRSAAASGDHGYSSVQHTPLQCGPFDERGHRWLLGKYGQNLNGSCNSPHTADRKHYVCSPVERGDWCDIEVTKSEEYVHDENQIYRSLSNDPEECFRWSCKTVDCKKDVRDRKCDVSPYVSQKGSAMDGIYMNTYRGCGKDCRNLATRAESQCQCAGSPRNTSTENSHVEQSLLHSQKRNDQSSFTCSCATDNDSLTKQTSAVMERPNTACVDSDKPNRGVRSLNINGPASSNTPQRNGKMVPTPTSCQSAVFKTPAPVTAPSQFASVKGQFLKPLNTPLKRRTKAPSSSGSSSSSSRRNVRVLARRSFVGIQESASVRHSPLRGPSTPRVIPAASPAHSEFDLALLSSAKRVNRHREADLTELSGPCTPTVRKLSSHQLRCWTDVRRPTACPSPAYSKPLSVMGWSQLSDTDSESVYTHSEDDSSSRSSEAGEDDQEKRTDKVSTMKGLCPGCHPPSQLQCDLNSRTYNIAMETSSSTCDHHREMREAEREFILRQKSNKVVKPSRPIPALSDVNLCRSCPSAKGLAAYDFRVSSSETEIGKTFVSPIRPTDLRNTLNVVRLRRTRTRKHKRQRVAYSQEELDNLSHGVETLGTKWNQILVTYKFHPSRTAVDLMEKHKRMVKSSNGLKKRARDSKPFSMCEERRLRRGVKTLGYNWKGILNMFRFSRGRRAEELRSRWRTLMKRASP
ncbi:uncharacterized protein [Haliotis cracherodii]|uniref:uncharacterized protein n=1 Tax=Haliotis cracherodii TaxID=6455 RepID=UPI0039ED3D58